MSVATLLSSCVADPRPLPAAIASTDLARVTVLREGLLRLQTRQTADGNWDDMPTLQVINRHVEPVPHFTAAPSTGSALTVETAAISITVNPANESATVACAALSGAPYSWSWAAGSPRPAGDFATLVSAAGMYILDDGRTARLDGDGPAAWFANGTHPSTQTDFYAFC
jgi:hypothetical protein